MIRTILTAAVAAAAIAAGPALAKPGGGQGKGAGAAARVSANPGASVNINAGGPAGAAIDSRINSMGPANASPTGILNASPNSVLRTHTDTTVSPEVDARVNSRGQFNANTRAIGRANANSALARGAVPATALPGLQAGLDVQTTAGADLGTVSQVVTAADGSIRLVIVTSPTGETFRLVPDTLSISGDVVTTTTVDIGG